jgi:hypothetical protein
VKLYVHAPISPPELWIMSAKARPPPGYLPLVGGEVTLRGRHAKPSPHDLVPAEHDALRAQLAQLLQAFEQLGEAGRRQLIEYAEALLVADHAA